MSSRTISKGAIFIVVVGILAFGGVVAGMAYSQSEESIPEWIRGLFTFWADEQINDTDLLNAIEFLVDTGTIKTSLSDRISELESNVEDLEQENALLRAENSKLQKSNTDQSIIEEPVREPIFIETESPILGDQDAKITIIEFGDYQCPNCKRWFDDTRPSIYEDYIQTGKVNLIFVDNAFIGPDSTNAAAASYCAEEQGMYWEYHNKLYKSQSGYKNGWAAVDNLKKFAVDLELDTEAFDQCLDSGKYLDRVKANTKVAHDSGLSRTPSFLIVTSDGEHQKKILGNQPFTTFKLVLDGLGK